MKEDHQMHNIKNVQNCFTHKMKRIGKAVLAQRRKLTAVMLTAFLLLTQSIPAYAAGISGSPIVTGTEKLIGDVTTWLMVLAPVVAGLLIIYFCIRRSAADEMDTKKWNNRIVVAIVSCIGAILGSATLNLIIGYYR
jgi:ABC-type molybdate transport system permease subunit